MAVHRYTLQTYKMAKCDEGYRCDVCGGDVETIDESDLYLRYVMGMVDPETLHTASERHIHCNPNLAQFIIDDDFEAMVLSGEFAKQNLDPQYVQQREDLVTRAYRRLKEIANQGEMSEELSVLEYPLAEVRARMKTRYS